LELYFPLQRRAWNECGATASRELAIDRERDRGGEMTVASDELLPIASQAVGGGIPGSKGGPAAELAIPRIARKYPARLGVNLGDNEGCIHHARKSKHPLDVGRDRYATRAARAIDEPEPRDLDRIFGGNELDQGALDPDRPMLDRKNGG